MVGVLQASIGTVGAQAEEGGAVAGSTSGRTLLGMNLIGEGNLDLGVRLEEAS